MRAVVIVGVVFALVGHAAAEPARAVRLEVTGPCDLASIDTRASELLGRAAIATDATARVVVMTAQDTDRVTASLSFIDENGNAQPPRTMAAASCEELSESVAIVISLVLRETAPPPLPPPPVSPPPAPPQPSDETLFTPTPLAPTSRALDLGTATSSARHTAFVLGGRLERRRSAFATSLAIAMPERVDVVVGAVHVTSARADAAACLRARSVAACGLVAGGLVRARGEDLMDARTVIRPQASLGLRVEWRQPVSRRVGVQLFAALEQLLVRPSFLVGDTAVWTEPLVQGWLGGGIFFRIP